ncbi:MAG: hypothetical protein CMH83_23000 [Nocardioides sp.]|nr:hypothetical protein [Nocardioides sp.]
MRSTDEPGPQHRDPEHPDVQAATDHVVRVMNDAWLGLLLSFGERLGLHEAMADGVARSTVEIGERAGVDARYVQEWVWGLVAGGMAAQVGDADAPRFGLRPGYEVVLTPRGGPAHWSRITTQITALATLEDQLVEAARTGGGIPASSYEGRIVEVLAGESGPIFARALLDEVVPLLGVTEALEAGGRVLDVGCGTGQALGLLAGRFPEAHLVGVDQSAGSVEATRQRVAEAGLTNVEAHVVDVEDLPHDGTDSTDPLAALAADGPFDLVMAANLVHDLADPAGFLARARRLLAPGGVLYLHELGFTGDLDHDTRDAHALGVLGFGLYHCLPLAKRREGIAPGGMWGTSSYVAALRAAGFTDVTVHRAPSDPNNDTILARLGDAPAD